MSTEQGLFSEESTSSSAEPSVEEVTEGAAAGANELVPTSVLLPEVIFAAGGAKDILAKLRETVMAVPVDISTEKGRKAVKSLVHKIARSKTALDGLGKELGDKLRAQLNPILDERRQIRDGCDALAETVRQPLTDWEASEEKRINAHHDALTDISATALFMGDPSAQDVRERLERLNNLPERDWGEFIQRAVAAKTSARAVLTTLLAETEAQEAAAVEAARIAAEEEEARLKKLAEEQAAREAEIARVAAEQAKAAAEQAAAEEAESVAEENRLAAIKLAEDAAAEKKRIEDAAAKAAADAKETEDRLKAEQQKLIDDAAEVERQRKEDQRVAYIRSLIRAINDCGNGFIGGEMYPYVILLRELEKKIVVDDSYGEFKEEALAAHAAALKKIHDAQERQAAADRKIETDRQRAVDDERKRLKDLRDEAERVGRDLVRKREADTSHKRKINGEAKAALMKACDLTEDQAVRVVMEIAKGNVPNVAISY